MLYGEQHVICFKIVVLTKMKIFSSVLTGSTVYWMDGSGSLIKEVEVFDPISEHLSNDDDEANIVAESNSAETMTTENNDRNLGSSNSHNDNIQKQTDVEHINAYINNEKIELMDMNEVHEDSNAIHHDAFLHEEDIPHADPKSFLHEVIFPPGERHRPMSIF